MTTRRGSKQKRRLREERSRCTELRALQVALALIVFRDDFGDMEGWDASIRGMLDMLTP